MSTLNLDNGVGVAYCGQSLCGFCSAAVIISTVPGIIQIHQCMHALQRCVCVFVLALRGERYYGVRCRLKQRGIGYGSER